MFWPSFNLVPTLTRLLKVSASVIILNIHAFRKLAKNSSQFNKILEDNLS